MFLDRLMSLVKYRQFLNSKDLEMERLILRISINL